MTERTILFFAQRPVSINDERTKSHWTKHKHTFAWREGFRLLAVEAKMPGYGWIEVEVRQVLPNKAGRQDLGNCLPAAKAAIDGLVDHGVIPDDAQEWLRRLTFLPALTIPGRLGLEMVVVGHDRMPRQWSPKRKPMRSASAGG